MGRGIGRYWGGRLADVPPLINELFSPVRQVMYKIVRLGADPSDSGLDETKYFERELNVQYVKVPPVKCVALGPSMRCRLTLFSIVLRRYTMVMVLQTVGLAIGIGAADTLYDVTVET